jgi:hypothetical protein
VAQEVVVAEVEAVGEEDQAAAAVVVVPLPTEEHLAAGAVVAEASTTGAAAAVLPVVVEAVALVVVEEQQMLPASSTKVPQPNSPRGSTIAPNRLSSLVSKTSLFPNVKAPNGLSVQATAHVETPSLCVPIFSLFAFPKAPHTGIPSRLPPKSPWESVNRESSSFWKGVRCVNLTYRILRTIRASGWFLRVNCRSLLISKFDTQTMITYQCQPTPPRTWCRSSSLTS